MDDLHQTLQDIFREVFDDEQLVLDRSLTSADVPGWDSMAHLNLIIAVEAAFGVRFATAEISRLKEDGQNVGTFIDLLVQKVQRGR
jgi:acyl carrier protein